MCGILGGFLKENVFEIRKRVDLALEQMSHRGPDDQSTYFKEINNGLLFLGHKRLSIIDLSSAGKQPMHTEDGRYSIVFNGEIYNYKEIKQQLKSLGYKFNTETDTEVLLYSWIEYGESILNKLKGMFAFVIYDAITEELTCIRDAFGIKPFFYVFNESGFYFSSEISPVLTLSGIARKPNLQRAYNYLLFCEYDSNEYTFFQGVNHLEPAHILKFDLKSKKIISINRWWWPSISNSCNLSFQDSSDYLRELFLDNLRLHLRSDVPVGAALSGGIDSSSVVCGIQFIEPDLPINTFSFLSPGQSFDESSWIDIVNKKVNSKSHKIIANQIEFQKDLDDMILTQGEPFTSTSIYAQYRVFRLAKENGVVVTLDGQGADELLAGYNGYPVQRILSLVDQNEYSKAISFFNSWLKWPGRSKSEIFNGLGNRLIPNLLRPFAESFAGLDLKPDWIDIDYLQEYGVKCKMSNIELSPDYFTRRVPEVLRNTLTKRGLQSLLRHSDRNSMRWSVESRVPFLTTDFAEFTLSLPEEFLISKNGESKSIFRNAMRGIVPDEIINRKDKIGFVTPEDDWLSFIQYDLDKWLTGIDDIPFLNVEKTKRKILNSFKSNLPITKDIWRIINYCRWHYLNKLQ